MFVCIGMRWMTCSVPLGRIDGLVLILKMRIMNNSTSPPHSHTKIGITLIKIDRAEGMHDECFESTHTTWADAEARIQSICATSPTDGGYSKTDFLIVFQDNQTYEGRADCAHPESKAYEGSLAQHIRDHVTFFAGQFRPSHMSAQEYADFLKQQEASNPGSKAEHAEWLEKYALDDESAVQREITISESP